MSSKPPALPDDPGEGEPSYEVGYGKPPRATRFQPGKSGNPKGRPKGSKKAPPADGAVEKLKALVLQEAYRPIKIKDGDALVDLPTIQAVLRNVTLSAAKGNQRAQRMLLDFVGGVEGERHRDHNKLFETAVGYKRRGEEQIALARRRGLPAPVLLPHPDHLIIDPMAGSVKVRGPCTHEEKVEWDDLIATEAFLRKRLADLEADRRLTPRRRSVKGSIASVRSVMTKVDAARSSFERILVPGLY